MTLEPRSALRVKTQNRMSVANASATTIHSQPETTFEDTPHMKP